VKEGKKFKRPGKATNRFHFAISFLRIAMLCSECKFYQPLETWQRPHLPVNERFGECRRNPPVTSCKPEDRDHQYQALFPTVRTNDWCGDFAPRMPRAGQRCEDEANSAFDAAAHDDATRGPVAARTGQCQPLPDRLPGRRD
jgi:hypothetical protein